MFLTSHVSIATSVVATDSLFQILIFPHKYKTQCDIYQTFFLLFFFQNFSVTRRLREDQGEAKGKGKGKTLVAKQEVRTLKTDRQTGGFSQTKK